MEKIRVQYNKSRKMWSWKRSGTTIIYSYFKKYHAVADAKGEAKSVNGQLIVHGKNGRIQYEHTYGPDPRDRKGLK